MGLRYACHPTWFYQVWLWQQNTLLTGTLRFLTDVRIRLTEYEWIKMLSKVSIISRSGVVRFESTSTGLLAIPLKQREVVWPANHILTTPQPPIKMKGETTHHEKTKKKMRGERVFNFVSVIDYQEGIRKRGSLKLAWKVFVWGGGGWSNMVDGNLERESECRISCQQ